MEKRLEKEVLPNCLPICEELRVSRDSKGSLLQAVCTLDGYSSPCIPIFCLKGEILYQEHTWTEWYSHQCDLEVNRQCIHCGYKEKM